MTSPSAETKDPEPPLLKRTDDFCTCSSHSAVGSKSYFSLSSLVGGALNSHMPSSAFALVCASVMRVTVMMPENRSWVFMEIPRNVLGRAATVRERLEIPTPSRSWLVRLHQ